MKLKVSKRFKKLLEVSEDKKIETIEEAIKKVKKNCTTKFDESIDVSFNLNTKQKKNEVTLRTLVNLPNGNGKKIKVAVLCEDSKIQEAKDGGADLTGVNLDGANLQDAIWDENTILKCKNHLVCWND